MKNASSGLIALLRDRNQYAMWETYTFTFADGSTVTWTNGDVPSDRSGETVCDLLLHFDETDPADWTDFSFNHRALTFHPEDGGAIQHSPDGILDVDPLSGLFPAVQFVQAHPGRREEIYYGKHSWMEIAGAINFGANDFFIEFNCTFLGTTNDFGYCVLWNIGVGDTGFYVYFIPNFADPTDLQLVFSCTTDLGQVREVRVDATQGFVGTKKRYGFSRAGKVLTSFVDGAISQQTTIFDNTEAILNSGRSFMRLGCSDNGTEANTIDGFNGVIDEFYVIHGSGAGRTTAYTPTTVEYEPS